MTQRKWGIHMYRKIKKHNWIPICPPIRSSHYFSLGLICQLPIQSKHSRRNPTWTNGMSLRMCLFIHRVRWNMKTAASNWFSVKEQTVTEKRCFPRHSWMHPDMEIFPCWQGLYQDFSLANAGLSCWFWSGLLQTTHWNTRFTESFNFRKQKHKCAQKYPNNPSETSACHHGSVWFVDWSVLYFSVWFPSSNFKNLIVSRSCVNLLECPKELVLPKHRW